MPRLHPRNNLERPASVRTEYEAHVERWSGCTACPLCTQRSSVVLARGSVPCDVLFVGEAPGQSEDVLGRPFVGPAGRLLDQIREAAWKSQDQPAGDGGQFVATWAMTNICACFPREAKGTEDHRPPKEAIKACAPRLREFVELCHPRLIVCVGALAKDWLHLAVDEASDRWEIVSIPHPAFILKSPTVNRPLLIKKCVVTLTNALDRMVGRES